MTTERGAVRRAVFPVAGFGTRFLPATKAMPKELLPVVDKPLIQYAAEEAVEAGIDTLVFVTGRNKRAIEDHFDANLELEAALTQRGKAERAAMVHDILPRGVECIFMRQAEQLGLGHAVLCAERAVGREPFAVLLADDFLTHDGPGTTRQLVSAFEASGRAQLSVMEVPRADAGKYGMIIPGGAPNSVAGLTEKPDPAEAPSTRASIGRYLLTPDVFDTLRALPPGAGGEIQLADAIDIHARRGEVEAVTLSGRRFDCGSQEGFVAATLHEYARRGGTLDLGAAGRR